MKQMYIGSVWPTKEQTLLLQACLFSGPEALKAWEAWKNCVDINKVDLASFKLLPLVSRNPSLDVLQDPIFEKCKGIYRHVWIENHLNWKKVLPLLEQLQKAGVKKIVLLKGMAMILHYYKDFGVRVIGDVDFLIEKEDLLNACCLLQSTGWKEKSKISRFDLKNSDHLNRWHARNLIHPAGGALDLHWSFLQENCSFLDQAVLKDSQPLEIANLNLHVPNSTDLLFQTCVHGTKYSEVPLIRWIPDAITIIKESKTEIDWDRFVELARIAHRSIPLFLALQYLKDHFDAPIAQTTLQKLKAIVPIKLESLEYKHNLRGNYLITDWCRYCINQGYHTLGSQLRHIPKYLMITARLKSFWQVPFFALYWPFKFLYRRLKTPTS